MPLIFTKAAIHFYTFYPRISMIFQNAFDVTTILSAAPVQFRLFASFFPTMAVHVGRNALRLTGLRLTGSSAHLFGGQPLFAECFGRAARFPPKKFEVMMNALGRAFSRNELIERALGNDFEGGPKNIDIHVSNLRKRIETDCGKPEYILTVSGYGYRFSAHGNAGGVHE